MSLQFTRPAFIACPTCTAKPGTPLLCPECLERRELHGLVTVVLPRLYITEGGKGVLAFRILAAIQICKVCNGRPNFDCPEHGR